MKASVQLKMLSRAGTVNLLTKGIQSRSQLTKFGGADQLSRAIGSWNFEKKPQRKYLLQIVHGRLQNTGTSVSFEANHALIGQLEQCLADGRPQIGRAHA